MEKTKKNKDYEISEETIEIFKIYLKARKYLHLGVINIDSYWCNKCKQFKYLPLNQDNYTIFIIDHPLFCIILTCDACQSIAYTDDIRYKNSMTNATNNLYNWHNMYIDYCEKVEQILLNARYSPNSPFYKEKFPLDVFKIIWHLVDL
jgi:hypothetical protein